MTQKVNLELTRNQLADLVMAMYDSNQLCHDCMKDRDETQNADMNEFLIRLHHLREWLEQERDKLPIVGGEEVVGDIFVVDLPDEEQE